MIGGSDNHSNYGGFPDAKDKCVAVSFQLSGNTHYGWIRVNVNSDVTESTIIGYAYETVADTPIHADDNVLPVELVLFNAQMQNKNVILNWDTATEVNNYGFEVQKLQDWKTIGFVKGHGNSNSPKTYAYTDNSISESGKYKYRLKQIDIDGKFEYSQEVEVNFEVP
ncbi:MAG: hypothetical protein GY936_01820, partial [Ignavibacteriae bacterium]|nr:hypothetical protein [Ignavibacteriota bacterium]